MISNIKECISEVGASIAHIMLLNSVKVMAIIMSGSRNFQFNPLPYYLILFTQNTYEYLKCKKK
jgi:hypothetical protein